MEMKCKAGPLLYVCTTKSFLPHLQVFPFVFSEFLYVQRLIGVVRLERNLFLFVLWLLFTNDNCWQFSLIFRNRRCAIWRKKLNFELFNFIFQHIDKIREITQNGECRGGRAILVQWQVIIHALLTTRTFWAWPLLLRS